MSRCILAIDQGTTSSRAVVFDNNARALASSAQQFAQHFPKSGWVEHNPGDLWTTSLATARDALKHAGKVAADVVAIGITNQRETIVVWDRDTGEPIHPAIVWQDRRTARMCSDLKSKGHEPDVLERTGLPLDPYFSATKLAWILDQVPGARQRADDSRLAAGTVDTFLIWKLTGGRVHATDATNASRTSLYNIKSGVWDDTLLGLFCVPKNILPEVKDCADDFGQTEAGLFGAAIPIRGVAGDQQAASIGQACFESGMMKATYGTGCFALLNTGAQAIASNNRLLTTIASRIDGKTTYALEGSIYIAGAGVQWLRDSLGILPKADVADQMAMAADEEQQITLVPAFTGLGAPYWDSECRGALFGLTRNTGPHELVKATLEAVCFQTADLLQAMKKDWPSAHDTVLRVDGGMSASDWTMQRLADLLDCPIERPAYLETTALGAAYVAGLATGFYLPPDQFAKSWSVERRFKSTMGASQRTAKLGQWRDAVHRTLTNRSDV